MMQRRVSYERKRAVADARQGWTLIRGSLSDWNGDPELRKVEELNGKVDRFGDAWYEFHGRREAACDADGMVSPWLVTLRLLEGRQVSLLDAIRAVNMIGRPSAGTALLRSVYESFLSILLIAFDTAPIAPELLRSKAESPSPTKEELAERFRRFGHHALLTKVESMEQIWGPSEILVDTIGSIREHGDSARRDYGFSSTQNTWHPFKGIWHMRNHLWPPGGEPRFPTDPLPIDYEIWRGFFFASYTEASHDVHSSSASHARHERTETENGLQMGSRSWSANNFEMAYHLVVLSVAALAYAEGHMELWVEELDRHGLLPDGDDEDFDEAAPENQ